MVLTHRALTAHRNLLLAAYAVLLALNGAFGTPFHFRLPDWEQLGGLAPLLVVAAKLVYAYAVYRLSRLLAQAWWLTLGYVILAGIGGFDLLPLAGLLAAVRLRRGMIETPPPAARG